MQNIHIFLEWPYYVLKAFTNLSADSIAELLVWWHMVYGELVEGDNPKKIQGSKTLWESCLTVTVKKAWADLMHECWNLRLEL